MAGEPASLRRRRARTSTSTPSVVAMLPSPTAVLPFNPPQLRALYRRILERRTELLLGSTEDLARERLRILPNKSLTR